MTLSLIQKRPVRIGGSREKKKENMKDQRRIQYMYF
jgi:hypothetical protein